MANAQRVHLSDYLYIYILVTSINVTVLKPKCKSCGPGLAQSTSLSIHSLLQYLFIPPDWHNKAHRPPITHTHIVWINCRIFNYMISTWKTISDYACRWLANENGNGLMKYQSHISEIEIRNQLEKLFFCKVKGKLWTKIPF